jgi:hypothetical protein
MKNFIKTISIVIYIFTTIAYADTHPRKDNIISTHYFKDIAIHKVENFAKNFKAGAPNERKVIVQALTYNINPKTPILGKILWTITGNQLPDTSQECLDAEEESCSEYESYKAKHHLAHWPICFKNCTLYGPEFLAFDEKSGKIYLSAPLGLGSNTEWSLMIYSANIHTKEIKKMVTEIGPVDVYLSPSGNYLVFAGHYLGVVDTNTNEIWKVTEPLITRQSPSKFVYVSFSHIKWLNNDTLQYQKIEYTDKFFEEPPTYVVTKILNVKSRTTKIVN